MKSVGVRELKNRLSEYLRQVRAGEGVLVTDRGDVIAEITAPGHRVADRRGPGPRGSARWPHSPLVLI